MAKVAVVFKVYPKDGQKAEVVAKTITEKLKPQGVQIEDIGFGIKCIKVLFMFDDAEESSSKMEEKLQATAGVGQTEVAEETLV
jgi:translation elongation factor EF-1beta